MNDIMTTNGRHTPPAIDPRFEWLTKLAPGEYGMIDGCLVGLATFDAGAAACILETRMTKNRKPNALNVQRLSMSMANN